MSPSVMLHFFPDVMRCHGPLPEPEIIHLRQFNLGSLSHLFIFAMLFSSPTLGYILLNWCTFTVSFSTQVVMSCHTSAALMGFPLHCQLVFPLVQPPSQSICHHPQANEHWSFLSFKSIWRQLDGFQLCNLTTLSFNSFCNSRCKTL